MSRLLLMIDGVLYVVINLHPDPRVASYAWRLRKEDGDCYDVHVGEFGPECTCQDFIWRREHREKNGCKHLVACQEQGLLPRGAP